MVGTRDKNLRSGHLKEDLGVFLLKSVALVAQTPNTEDVGIDAFATLLRSKDVRTLTAEDSFLVQFKASSVRAVLYDGRDAVDWLSSLEMPLLIGSVDLAAATLSLYSTLALSQALLEQQYDSIRLHLDPPSEACSSAGTREVWLGTPIMTWSVPDLAVGVPWKTGYAVLKPHIETLRRNIRLRPLGQALMLNWNTNEVPHDNGRMYFGSANSTSEDIRSCLEIMKPALHSLISNIMVGKRYRILAEVMPFIASMRKYGLEIDNTTIQVALLAADGEEISEEEMILYRSLAIPGQLDLSFTAIADDALRNIPDGIEKLALRGTRVSDAGIPHLTALSNLTHLNLESTLVTDDSVSVIASLLSLRWLNITATGITTDGVRRLRADPNLVVVADTQETSNLEDQCV